MSKYKKTNTIINRVIIMLKPISLTDLLEISTVNTSEEGWISQDVSSLRVIEGVNRLS